MLRVEEGHVRRQTDESLRYERVPGHIRLTAPTTSDFIPSWALKQMRRREPGFASDGHLVLLNFEALAPGLVRVQGVWRRDYHNVIRVVRNSNRAVSAQRVCRACASNSTVPRHSRKSERNVTTAVSFASGR